MCIKYYWNLIINHCIPIVYTFFSIKQCCQNENVIDCVQTNCNYTNFNKKNLFGKILY